MRWTDEMVAVMRAGIDADVPNEELAVTLDISVKALEGKQKRMGLYRCKPRDPDAVDWSDKKNITLLKTRWNDGVSASLIADEMHTTKGTIIGKAHRLNLIARTTGGAQGPVVVRTRTITRRRRAPIKKPGTRQPRIASPSLAPPQTPEPEHQSPVRFIDMQRHHCRWVIGEPKALLVCGKRRCEGSPYCFGHDSLAYTQPTRRTAA